MQSSRLDKCSFIKVDEMVQLVFIDKTHTIYTIISNAWDSYRVPGSVNRILSEYTLPRCGACLIEVNTLFDSSAMLVFVIPNEHCPMYVLALTCITRSFLNDLDITSAGDVENILRSKI